MNRRLHELELELRRLENEREELAAAYKEAEAVSKSIPVFLIIFSLFCNIFTENFNYYLTNCEMIFKKINYRDVRLKNNVPRDCLLN